MHCPNVDVMLDGMEGRHLREWIAFDRIEAEMAQRETLQAKADASLEAMKRQRGRR